MPDTLPARPRDPLLATAKVFVLILCGLAIFAMVMVGIGIGAVLTVQHSEILSKIAEVHAPDGSIWLIVAALLLIEGMLWFAFRFFRELHGIISSVGEGEAFNPENAKRLSRMGWLTVWAQGVGLAVGGIATFLAPYMHKAGHKLHMDAGLDFGGVLTALLLFILARVFREGAAMREDLEGTV